MTLENVKMAIGKMPIDGRYLDALNEFCEHYSFTFDASYIESRCKVIDVWCYNEKLDLSLQITFYCHELASDTLVIKCQDSDNCKKSYNMDWLTLDEFPESIKSVIGEWFLSKVAEN